MTEPQVPGERPRPRVPEHPPVRVGPRLRRARVDHLDTDDTLILRPRYSSIVLSALLGIGVLVAAGFTMAAGRAHPGIVVSGVLIGLGMLCLAALAALAREPLLTVSRRGLSAPMTASGIGLLTWPRVARVYPQYAGTTGLAVDLWCDPEDHTAGMRRGLFVPGGMWPMSVTRLLREIDDRRPDP